jgi:hypothetical protein
MTFFMLYWKQLALAAAVAAWSGYMYMMGVNHEKHKALVENAIAVQEAVKAQAARDSVTLATEKASWEASERVKTVTKTIVKVIHDEKPSASCTLSNGWVQRHNEAATNTLPQPPTINYEAYSGVTADQALETVAENYGAYHETYEIAKGCQGWINSQLKLNGDK